MLTRAVILAGGKGTRLASRLNGLPKPLVEVAGVPLLERQLLHCKAAGIRSALVLVNHLADRIAGFCRAKNNFGLDLSLADDGEPRGTAGAVLAALPLLTADEDLLIVYGDTLFNVDLERFYAAHARCGADASLFLHPNDHPRDSDLVGLNEENFIVRFLPYPHPPGAEYPNLVNAALYIVRRAALEPRRGLGEGPPRAVDFVKELFPAMLEAGQKLYGYISPEYVKDIGTPERLDAAEADMASGRFAGGTLKVARRAVFLDRDGTLNEDRGYISRPEQLTLLPGAARAVRRLNRAGLPAVLVTNQPVLARGECTEDELRAVHARLEHLLGLEGAYLDRIYYCPHHPDKGFAGERPELKIACACRKPGIGMLRRAAADMRIDLARSWLVGDRTADIQCARNAGARSILVGAGTAGEDRACDAVPDFRAENLKGAVDIILAAEGMV
ncbi:MAG: HAD-IIIA family hydrolase [Desulfovibrio sp.]|jgi:histidinol-phosphate phosphatase family protein|nr:HAD-IIIA family hydrolase [Desulfovibrio sp.]